MKKRNQFIKRIGAFLCALVVTLSCVGVASPYYASGSSCYAIDLHNQFRNSIMEYGIEYKDNLPEVSSDYKFCTKFIFYNNANVVTCLLSNSPIVVKSEYDKDWKEYYLKGYFDLDNSVLYISTDSCNTWTLLEENAGGVSYSGGYYYMGAYSIKSNGVLDVSSPSAVILDSSHPVYCEHGTVIFGEKEEVYNSSLGYLQDVVQQQLYLEDDAWAVVSDTLMRKYSFSKTTTTGLDITVGDWGVRHYKQLEIRDLDDDKVVKTYDKVLCGEYPASELKFMFHIKDTINNVHSASGFEGLSWWELEVLGHYMFYNDYLELVRYNEDGSVEYGGQLKIWKTSKNVFYTEKLDENGEATDEPLGNITHGGSGSGSTYEEAEKEADKNDNGSIGSSNFAGLETALGSFTSTIKVIPDVIASVFSFLPPWCLELCGIGFALLIVLIIYKTVT